MNVNEVINVDPGHTIEFGAATWDATEVSVRNRYDGSTGRFSPHASSEIPLDDLNRILVETAKRDLFARDRCVEMIVALAESCGRLP